MALKISSEIGAIRARRGQLVDGSPVASCRTKDNPRLSVAPRSSPIKAPFFTAEVEIHWAPCSRRVRVFLMPKSRRVSGP